MRRVDSSVCPGAIPARSPTAKVSWSIGLVTVFFTCDAPVSAQTFTVPPAVLLALPGAGGGIAVNNFTLPTNFSAPGLDFGFATSYASVFESTFYQ